MRPPILTKYRVQDDSFKRQLAADSLHVCERHFLPEEIEICKYITCIYNFLAARLGHAILEEFYNLFHFFLR